MATYKLLARLVALCGTVLRAGVAASPRVEEQTPMANPALEAVNDTIWTSSPLYERALSLMKQSPLIDTHIDLPQVIRSLGKPILASALAEDVGALTSPTHQIVTLSPSSPILRLT